MIKSEVNKKQSKPFPKLMISNKGQIVLMFKPGCGTVIRSSVCKIGWYSEGWAIGDFIDFEDSLILSNE